MICTRVRERLEDLELGFLEPDLARAYEAHLRECSACRADLDEVRSTLEVLHGLSDPASSSKLARIRRPPFRAGRLAIAAAAACAIFAAGLSAAGLLRPDRSEADARVARILGTVAEQQRFIQQLRDERLLDQEAARALRDELRAALATRSDALARLEASSAQRQSAQRDEIARLEQRMSGMVSDLARCVASNARAAPAPPVASAPAPLAAQPGLAPRAEPEEVIEADVGVPLAPGERGLTLAPRVWKATYRFVADLIRKRESGFDETVVAFREELLHMEIDQE